RTTAARTGAGRALPAWTLGTCRGGRGQFALATDDVALVNPHFHADAAEGGLGFVEAVVDVRPQRVQRNAAFAVELRAAHLGTAEAARALHTDAFDIGLAHCGLDCLTHGTTERDTVGQLLGDALSNQLCLRLRVFHLEDVQLDLLAGELLQVGSNAVGFGTATTDHDAWPRRVDVDADAVARALDLHVGNACALESGGQQTPDRHIFLDVVGVLLVGVPAGLPVGGDAQPEAVRVDLLAHYCEPPFASSEAFLAGSFFAGSAFFAAGSAFLAGAFFAGAFAAALLPSARRLRAALAERPRCSSRLGRLSTTTVIWLVRLRIRNARP